MSEKHSIKIYCTLYRQMYNNYIPLITYSSLQPDGACIHPGDVEVFNRLGPQLLQETANVLYDKLTTTVDPEDKPATEILDIYYISRDGYTALYELMRRYNPSLQTHPDMWSPEWRRDQTVFEYVGALVSTQKRKTDRHQMTLTEDDMKMELLLCSCTLPQFQGISNMILFLHYRFGHKALKHYPFGQLIRF